MLPQIQVPIAAPPVQQLQCLVVPPGGSERPGLQSSGSSQAAPPPPQPDERCRNPGLAGRWHLSWALENRWDGGYGRAGGPKGLRLEPIWEGQDAWETGMLREGGGGWGVLGRARWRCLSKRAPCLSCSLASSRWCPLPSYFYGLTLATHCWHSLSEVLASPLL